MGIGIIVKNYQHINRSFKDWDTPTGKYIRSKAHYNQLMKEQGMIPQKEADQIADKVAKTRRKPYKLTPDTQQLLQSVKNSTDKNGKVHLGGVAVKKMIDMGAIGKKEDLAKLPKHYLKGGFDNASD